MSEKSASTPKPGQGHTGLPGNAQNRSRTTEDVVEDETYIQLRSDNRVVMRHAIALNLDSFKPATDDFAQRPQRTFPALQAEPQPFFSVIIPNYNGRAHLAGVLDALAGQSFGDFETILADDASGDDSVAFVEQNYPWVRVLVGRRNVGFAANCNAAAAAARGRVLVMLNNDTEPEADFLAELARAVCAHPAAAVVAAKLLLFDQRQILHTAGDLLGVDGIPHNRGVWQQDGGQFDQLPVVFSGCGGGSAYRREVWQALGGFDEGFHMYLEDVDYAFRARLQGHQVIFAPGARAYHKLSASGGDTLSSYYVGRNTIWNIVKNMPTSLLLRHLPAILVSQLRIALDALNQVRGEAAQARLRGQWHGVLGIPAQWRKRQLIQARRRATDQAISELLMHE